VGIRRKRKIATEPQLVCNRAITIDSLKFDIKPYKNHFLDRAGDEGAVSGSALSPD
jgi:hypothetical protein